MTNTRRDAFSPSSRLQSPLAVRLRHLCRGREGASALEFALVLPILLFLLTGIIDVGHIFFIQSSMQSASREAARSLAVGEIDKAAAERKVRDRLAQYSTATFTVVATLPDPADPTDMDLTVNTSVPVADVVLIDLVGLSHNLFQSGTLQSEVTMRKEN